MLQTWEVTCVECKQKKWPYVLEKPTEYVCMLCRGGVSAGRRAAGRAGGLANIARKRQQVSSDVHIVPTNNT